MPADTPKLTLPTIHINGTGPKTLMEGYRAAYDACFAAINAFDQIELHSRDYYIQGPAAWNKACEENASRVARLTAVKDELMEIMLHVLDTSRPGSTE